MSKNDDAFEIIDKVLEEKNYAETVIASWNCPFFRESYRNGILESVSKMTEQEAYDIAKEHFGSDSLAVSPKQNIDGEKSEEALYSETILSPSDYERWCSFTFPIIQCEIKSNTSRRTINYRSDGNISLYKEGRSWPRKKDALVSYEGTYNVASPEVKMAFAVNREDGLVSPQRLEASLEDTKIVFKNGDLTIERDTMSSLCTVKIFIVDSTKWKTVEAKLIFNGENLQSGFLRTFNLDKGGALADSIRIVSDEQGRRNIKSTPVIGRPDEKALLSEFVRIIEEIVPDIYKGILLDYVTKIRDSKGPVTMCLDDILLLEREAIDLLGVVRGELILAGLTSRVDSLIKSWKEELGLNDKKTIKMTPLSKKE